MMQLTFAFWMYVMIFALIGSMRGWAKELLVTFGVVLSLFIIAVLERFVPTSLRDFLNANGGPQFWMRTLIVLMLVLFAYQTPNLPKVPQGRFAREKLSDAMLGFFLGALNGFLVVGTVWYFMHISDYPFKPYITKPDPVPGLVDLLPPKWLIANNSPYIYFGVAAAFLFVIVVFI
jgi:hypothetical protein